MSTLSCTDVVSTTNKILIPPTGSIIQTVTKRTDARVTYSPNSIMTELDIDILPTANGNTILVEWNISFEASHNDGVFVLINGSPYNITTPLAGFSLSGIPGYLDTNRGYVIVNYDGSQSSTPQTMSILFSHRVTSINNKKFSIVTDGGNFDLNRSTIAAADNVEQTVSFVTAYEIVGG